MSEYVKFNTSDLSVIKYPYSFRDYLTENPGMITAARNLDKVISSGVPGIAKVLPSQRPDAALAKVTGKTAVRTGGVWVQEWQTENYSAEESAAILAAQKDEYRSQLRAKIEAKMSAGVTVNGLLVDTSPVARSLLALGQIGGKPSRKIVAKGGKAILTGAEFNAMVQAIDDFGQAVMNHGYDLHAAIDNATTIQELQAVDLDAGWPE